MDFSETFGEVSDRKRERRKATRRRAPAGPSHFQDDRFTWLQRRHQFQRYGRLEIGQHVRWGRNTLAPTNHPGPYTYRQHPEVEIATEHRIVDIRETETGCALILADADGCMCCVCGIDSYGHEIGGFGPGITVLQPAPRQQTLPLTRSPA